MGQINLNNFKVITDKLNTFFVDNKFMVASEIPTTGEFKVGDIIVNIGPNSAEEPMWICVKAGTPGVWELCSGVNEEEIADIVQANALTAVDYTDGVDIHIVGGEIGNMNELQTTDKSSLVGAINELFQDVDSGKQLIADAIDDSSINKNSTFGAMSEAIEDMQLEAEDIRNTLAGLMQEGGYDITGDEDIDSLLDLLVSSGISFSEIKQIVCGVNHTFILKNDGSIWSCGFNYDGQLGLGDTTNRKVFTQVTTNINNDVKQIACGSDHTFILKNDGSVWVCGGNYGQLGLGEADGNTHSTFTQVTTNVNNDVKQIACGEYHTFIIKNDGSLWSCGYNYDGELGLGNTTDKSTFTKVTTNINNDVKQVACGVNHTFILKNDGSVWCCGDNAYGQLGLGEEDIDDRHIFTQVTTNINNDVKQIACGTQHTFILKNDGSIWGCGSNGLGQLGLGDTIYYETIFTQVTTNINNDVKQVACGIYHTIILKNDGSVWSCGHNQYGQLGLGNTNEYYTSFTQVTTNVNNDIKQIACGNYHTFILKNDDSVWSCGLNDKGQLGLNTPDENILVFTNTGIDEVVEDGIIIRSRDIKQVACGENHVIILKKDGSVYSCGYNYYGQLGLGDTTSKYIFTKVTTNINNDVKQIACGSQHTFILKNDGSIWSCGNGVSGQLGSGTATKDVFTQVTTNINNDVKQIACCGEQTFILKTDGSLWACGYNSSGQLGLNDTSYKTSFKQVTTNINNDVKQIACGGAHTFILKNDGSVWACGYNQYGQLGLGDTTNYKTFTQVTTNINNDVKQIACGYEHTFILKNDGSIWSCGYNNAGRLGLGTSDNNAHSTFTKVTTNVNNDVKQIVCGYNYTFILKNDGSIWSCGYNKYGQLGLGSETDQKSFTQVTTNINNDIKQIVCGESHTFILKNDGSIWSCGWNGYGELGLGDTTKQTSFTQSVKTILVTVTFD